MGLRVGLTYNVKSEYVLKPDDPPDLIAEFDHEETVAHIEAALREGGHQVIRIGNARRLLERMGYVSVDIVLHRGGLRRPQPGIPSSHSPGDAAHPLCRGGWADPGPDPRQGPDEESARRGAHSHPALRGSVRSGRA